MTTLRIETDISIVRQALGELSTYGRHASQHPMDLPAVPALARLEATLTRYREALETIRDQAPHQHEMNRADEGVTLEWFCVVVAGVALDKEGS